MAQTECILTEDFVCSFLLMAELADRPSVFPPWWVAKVAPGDSKYTIHLYSWYLKKFLAKVYRILYLRKLGEISAAHPVANFQICHTREGGGGLPNFSTMEKILVPGWFFTLQFYFTPKTPFDPPYRGSEKTDPPFIWQKKKIILESRLTA